MTLEAHRHLGLLTAIVSILAISAACAPHEQAAPTTSGTSPARAPAPAPPPTWTFDPAMVFPADRSLARPEDGIALPDGRLIVSDQVHGLRLIEKDGSTRPFGDMRGAGYLGDSPGKAGEANGVSLEPGGTHALVADVLGGGIYRVDVAKGATERVYQHRFGVNSAVRDSTGAIWFTQSAENTPDQGEAGVFGPVDVPAPTGALLRVPMRDGKPAAQAEVVVGGLYYANGLVLDEKAGALYLAELGKDRVLRFRVDVATGKVDGQTTLLAIPLPDNLEMDGQGRLWVALPVRNEVIVVDTATGDYHSVFRAQTAEQEATAAEFVRRGVEMKPRLDLLTPAMSEPLPGFVTGVILSGDEGAAYLTGLGNALVKLER